MEYLSPSLIIADLERLINGEPPVIPLPILAVHLDRYFWTALTLGHKVEPTGDDSGLSLTQVYELEEDPQWTT